MANEVIWFDSAETGAPTLNNAAGSLIAVLDACLLNGFNLKSITINVAGGVATATCNGHGFSTATGKLVSIAGATPNELNGLKQIASATSNTFTFPAPGVPDGAATGAITAKRAPLGWTKVHAAANKAAAMMIARIVRLPQKNFREMLKPIYQWSPSRAPCASCRIVVPK